MDIAGKKTIINIVDESGEVIGKSSGVTWEASEEGEIVHLTFFPVMTFSDIAKKYGVTLEDE